MRVAHLPVRNIVFEIDLAFAAESQACIERLQVGLCVDADVVAGPARQVVFDAAPHQFLAESLAAHRRVDDDPAERALRIRHSGCEAALVGQKVSLAGAEHVTRPLVEVVEVEVGALLLDHEHLLAQAQERLGRTAESQRAMAEATSLSSRIERWRNQELPKLQRLRSVPVVRELVWTAPRIAHFLLSFLAVQCCLNAFLDLRTLFLLSATTNVHSDAAAMAQMTFIPATFWAVAWMVISLIALVFALRSYTHHLRS